MDWAKAKTVLIAVFLAANLILGGMYLSQVKESKASAAKEAENAASYLESMGAELAAPLPQQTPKLPVLFVEFSQEAASAAQPAEYEGLSVEGGAAGLCPAAAGTGDTKRKVASASSRVPQLASELGAEGLNGLVINSVELVYWVDSSSFAGAAREDTAVPAWKFRTNKGDYYYRAYGE